MKKFLVLIILSGLALTGCGFHLKNNTEVPAQFKTLSFSSYDMYGMLSRSIYERLNDNNVEIIMSNSAKQHPLLKVISSSLSKSTVSIYQDGKAAENQLVLIVNAQIIMPNQKIYPIHVRIFRSFFDNPATALSKSTEQELIEKEMYNDAAVQTIGKLKTFSSVN